MGQASGATITQPTTDCSSRTGLLGASPSGVSASAARAAVLDDDPIQTFPISRPVEQAIEKIRTYAWKDAQAPADDEEEILFSSRRDHTVPIPYGQWTEQERSLLEAAVKYYRSRAAAYRDHPEPAGKQRSDSSAWLRRFTTAIPTGRHRDLLATMPQWERHILETCRTSGSEVLMPHPAHPETLPRYLRVEEIARRLGIDLMPAAEFQLYFLILDLDPQAVDRYATAVRKHTHPELFKPDDLARQPGLHPDVLLIQLSRVSAELLKLEPSEDDAMEQGVTPHYDTDIGTYDEHELVLENDGEPLDHAPDLIVAEHDDEDDELLADEAEDPGTEGQFDAIAYHKLGHGDAEPDELDADPLFQQIVTAPPQAIARLKKELWTQQTQNPRARSRAAWTHLWLRLKAHERYCTERDVRLNRALSALELAPSYKAVRALGARMFGQSQNWPSHARKKFWARYQQKKEMFEKQSNEAAA